MLEITNIQQDEINYLIDEYLRTDEGEEILEEYFINKFKDEYKEQLETILENEELIRTMEKTIDELSDRLESEEFDKFRESYLDRNSLERVQEEINESKEQSLNESSNTENQGYRDIVTLTEHQRESIQTFSPNTNKVQEIIEVMNREKISFNESLEIVFYSDRHLRGQILNGVQSLSESKGVLGLNNRHLY